MLVQSHLDGKCLTRGYGCVTSSASRFAKVPLPAFPEIDPDYWMVMFSSAIVRHVTKALFWRATYQAESDELVSNDAAAITLVAVGMANSENAPSERAIVWPIIFLLETAGARRRKSSAGM
jgi:hypothetical protein